MRTCAHRCGRHVLIMHMNSDLVTTQIHTIIFVEQESMNTEAYRIPNSTHQLAPVGAEENATLIKVVNQKPTFDFATKDHVQLGENLGILDLESGARTSGRYSTSSR